MSSLSLYSVQSILILDSQGKRVYAKYYQPPPNVIGQHPGQLLSHAGNDLVGSLKKQEEFEKKLVKKTHKQDSEIMLFENKLVLYKEYIDLTIYLIGDVNENEIVLQTAFSALKNSLELILKNGIDKKNVQEHYDMVLLTIDEIVDNGIILETDPQTIASRVSKPPTSDNQLPLDLDKGLLGAWGFAKSKLQERLQQGL
ncbi:coatomer subunit zeta [Monosporozyma unispora]|nr:Golgi-to-ER vesicle coat component [Kazachstania unispora]